MKATIETKIIKFKSTEIWQGIVKTQFGYVTIFDRKQWQENSFDIWLNKNGRKNGKMEIYCGKVSSLEINEIEKLIKRIKEKYNA